MWIYQLVTHTTQHEKKIRNIKLERKKSYVVNLHKENQLLNFGVVVEEGSIHQNSADDYVIKKQPETEEKVRKRKNFFLTRLFGFQVTKHLLEQHRRQWRC